MKGEKPSGPTARSVFGLACPVEPHKPTDPLTCHLQGPGQRTSHDISHCCNAQYSLELIFTP